MSAFTNLLGNLFSGFLPSIISMFTGLDNKGWTPDRGAQHVAEDLASLQDQNLLSNYFRKTTGASLTDAEREANEWNRQQVLDAWDRQMEADNTKYQRQVADLQAAGLNPMLAAGNSAHVPTAAVASSVSPSAAAFNIGDLVSLLRLNSDVKLASAAVKEKEASAKEKSSQAEKNISETRQIDLLNNYVDESEKLRLRGLELANNMTEVEIRHVNKQIDVADEQINLMIRQENSEEKKAALYDSQILLNNANAKQIEQLRPFVVALTQAQTEQARAAAALSMANAAYQNGLIDNDYIRYVVKQANHEAREHEVNADMLTIKRGLRNGDFGNIGFTHGNVAQRFIQGFINFADALALKGQINF